MKYLAVIAIAILTMSAGWRSDFSVAKSEAAKEHKMILLKFSGSDWCVPCIRMEKNVFEQDTFEKFATRNLVMVNADFPRLKKNQLAKEVIKQNEMLAEQYDKTGHFPYTVLLNAEGKVLKVWDGDPKLSPEDFVGQIKTVNNGN